MASGDRRLAGDDHLLQTAHNGGIDFLLFHGSILERRKAGLCDRYDHISIILHNFHANITMLLTTTKHDLSRIASLADLAGSLTEKFEW